MKIKRDLFNVIKNYRFHSIYFKNLRLILLLVLIPLCVTSCFLYYTATSVVINEAALSNESTLYRTRDLCDTLFGQAELLAANATLNGDVEMLMMNHVNLAVQNVEENTISNINDFINMYTLVYEYIHSMYIYTEKNEFVVSNYGNFDIDEFSDNQWLELYRTGSGGEISIQSRILGQVYPYVISFIKPVSYDDDISRGAVIVNIDIKKINELLDYEDASLGQVVFLTAQDGTILYSNQLEQILTNVADTPYLQRAAAMEPGFTGRITIDREEYLVSVEHANVGDQLKYVSITPLAYYQDKFTAMTYVMLAVLLLTTLMEFVIVFFVSVKTYQPFGSIMKILRDEKSGDTETELLDDGKFDELKFITSSIMKTISSKEQAEAELTDRLESLNNMHIVALQTQINPHFLFNTLETINWMAEELTDGDNAVTASVQSLSKLVRMYYTSDSYLIQLSEEEACVRLYISILQLRYSDMFTVDWNICADFEDNIVPKFCLQPIIENAVYHGIKPKETGGHICISAYLQNKQLVLQVTDNGVGMDDSAMQALNDGLHDNYTLKEKHIGMHNINQRIRLIFGDAYGIEVSHGPEGGLCVTIRLPDIKHML